SLRGEVEMGHLYYPPNLTSHKWNKIPIHEFLTKYLGVYQVNLRHQASAKSEPASFNSYQSPHSFLKHDKIPLTDSTSYGRTKKTKPTQNSVRALRGLGLSPDLIVCRSTKPIEMAVKQKISMFCHVEPEQVIFIHDVSSTYRVPILLEEQGIITYFKHRLDLPVDDKPTVQLLKWKRMADRYLHTKRRCSDPDNDPDRCSVAVWSLESCHTDRSPATNDAGNQGKHRLLSAGPRLVTRCLPGYHPKSEKNKRFILTFRCLSPALCFSVLAVSTAAGKQSDDVTALLSGRCALSECRKAQRRDRQRKDGNQGKHRVTKRDPALSNAMFTLLPAKTSLNRYDSECKYLICIMYCILIATNQTVINNHKNNYRIYRGGCGTEDQLSGGRSGTPEQSQTERDAGTDVSAEQAPLRQEKNGRPQQRWPEIPPVQRRELDP
ncbi:unnamed protein product, partial [Ranitomeya imitator]